MMKIDSLQDYYTNISKHRFSETSVVPSNGVVLQCLFVFGAVWTQWTRKLRFCTAFVPHMAAQ